MYLDGALEAVELLRQRHPSHQQGRPHVGQAHHQLLGLPLDLDRQLPGGGHDQRWGRNNALANHTGGFTHALRNVRTF